MHFAAMQWLRTTMVRSKKKLDGSYKHGLGGCSSILNTVAFIEQVRRQDLKVR